MASAIPWLAGGAVAVVVCVLLVGFTAWLRFLDDEDTRDVKHRRRDQVMRTKHWPRWSWPWPRPPGRHDETSMRLWASALMVSTKLLQPEHCYMKHRSESEALKMAHILLAATVP